MPGSREKTSGGCFSAVLSRLLCSGGLPTHPSERLIEPGIEKSERRKASGSEEGSRRSSNPGVVARLMGLEAFPAENRRERTLGDYFRSKSVNSIDFLSHFDPAKPRDRRHRRVKTSVSFRDGLSDEFASVVLLLEEEFQAKMEAEGMMREKQGKVFPEGNDGEIEEKRKSVYAKNVEIKVKRKLVHGNSALSKTKKKNLEGKRRTELKEERRPLMKGELKKKRRKINLAHKLNCDFKKTHPQPHQTAPGIYSL